MLKWIRKPAPPIIPVDHHVEIEELDHGRAWRVHFKGEILVPFCRDPEFDAARELKRQGMIGTMVTFGHRGNGVPRARVNIERAARLVTTSESSRLRLAQRTIRELVEVDPKTDMETGRPESVAGDLDPVGT
jgi:hypothetical protein